MNLFNLPAYGPQTTALAAVAMNAAEAARTSAAIEVRNFELLNLELSYALSGAVATDKLTIYILASQDNGTTFRLLRQIATDGDATIFAPTVTISAAEDTANLVSTNLGSLVIAGLTHVKILAAPTNVAGTAGANDLLTVKVRPSRR